MLASLVPSGSILPSRVFLPDVSKEAPRDVGENQAKTSSFSFLKPKLIRDTVLAQTPPLSQSLALGRSHAWRGRSSGSSDPVGAGQEPVGHRDASQSWTLIHVLGRNQDGSTPVREAQHRAEVPVHWAAVMGGARSHPREAPGRTVGARDTKPLQGASPKDL